MFHRLIPISVIMYKEKKSISINSDVRWLKKDTSNQYINNNPAMSM